ncbi:aldo/keto reductase [Kiritimatiella glycovorans]|uniref:Putative oxidoreductase n=1 Tax=Kiritimatiella glycovorans TaxID=1307763 RepID=A0A0G3EDF4_9BACT|nr:aldo/keto reductase [Kiritimatiella glycovorans]AKJ63417.1 putative oxidoreductase [Kiritimatiella glycovorans]
MSARLNRRHLLQGTGLAALAAAGGGARAAESDEAAILNHEPGMPYRRLGNTDIRLSVLSLGGIKIDEQGITHHHAIDRGCNLVHISNGYRGGVCIRRLGKVMKTKRDRVYIALKDNFLSREDYRKRDFSKIDQWLKVLNTDHVDFLMFNRHKGDQAAEAYMRESLEILREQGKVRFAGLTTHGDIKNCLRNGIESGTFHLLNPALNQPNLEALEEELRDAHERQLGVMAMKTMKGQKSRADELAFLKKLLRNPALTTILKGMDSPQMFDEYLAAARTELTAAEDERLYRTAQRQRAENCMMCDACKRACPEGIEISTVLRCKDYYLEQERDPEYAFEQYHAVAPQYRWSADCTSCRRCEAACPNGIGIVARLEAARKALA